MVNPFVIGMDTLIRVPEYIFIRDNCLLFRETFSPAVFFGIIDFCFSKLEALSNNRSRILFYMRMLHCRATCTFSIW